MKKEDVKYLVFEGGGGKGSVYLGALVALEDLRILPIRPLKRTVSKNHIPYYLEKIDGPLIGIAGSSAGAITALALSMGMTSSDLASEMANQEQFLDFFDQPKQKNEKNNCEQRIKSVEDDLLSNYKRSRGIKLTNIKDLGWGASTALSFLRKNRDERSALNRILNRITMNTSPNSCYKQKRTLYTRTSQTGEIYPDQGLIFENHVQQLLYGSGLFPAFGSRTFFKSLLLRYLFGFDPLLVQTVLVNEENGILNRLIGNVGLKQYLINNKQYINDLEMLKKLKDGTQNTYWEKLLTDPTMFFGYLMNLPFSEFFYLTGVDLKITGCNVSRSAPRIFSRDYTPLFPVIEAVGISMNIPVLFSPIAVRCNVTDDIWFNNIVRMSKAPNITCREYNNQYKGLYIDGGMQLNYPIHLFNTTYDNPFEEYALIERRIKTLPFNKNVLGFQLDLNDNTTVTLEKDQDVFKELEWSNYAGKLIESIMFYSEKGQIIDSNVKKNTITLDTKGIGTLDFAPSRRIAEEPIKKAYRETINGLLKDKLPEDHLNAVIRLLAQ